jgi:hypothetical protein
MPVDPVLPAQTSAEPGANEPGADPDDARSMDRWWRESSYDLLRGLVVREFTDTLPADLLDDAFKQ